MVNTRRQRQLGEDEVSETQSRPRSVSSARGTGGTGIAPPSVAPSVPGAGGTDAIPPPPPSHNDNRPPGTPPGDANPPPGINNPPQADMPPLLPPSPSLSNVSFAGPGQRGRQLLALATPFDREAYMIGLEKLNEHFARAIRQNGVEIPPRESSFNSLLIDLCFSLFGL